MTDTSISQLPVVTSVNPTTDAVPVNASGVTSQISPQDLVASVNTTLTAVSVIDYGADPTGSTDSSSAVQSAITSNPGRPIYFPSGTYLINSQVNVSTSNSIIGDGTDSTIILVAAGITGFYITASGVRVADIGIGCSSQATSGMIFNLDNEIQRVVFDHISSNAANTVINTTNAAQWTVINSNFTNYYSSAINVQNVTANDAGDSNVEGCVFNANNSTGVAILQESSGGLRVVNNKFLSGAYHYLGQFSTSQANTSIFVFADNSTESASTANVAINTSSYPFSQIVITGNQFSVLGTAINFVGNNASGVEISGNNFHDVTGSSSATGIGFDASSSIHVGANLFQNFGNGIVFNGNAQAHVDAQTFYNCSNSYAGIQTNQTFGMGQAQNGQAGSWPLAGAYGSLWCTGDQSVSFNAPFPGTPNIAVSILGSGSSGIGYEIDGASSTGFTINVVGVNQNNNVSIAWQAWMTGQ